MRVMFERRRERDPEFVDEAIAAVDILERHLGADWRGGGEVGHVLDEFWQNVAPWTRHHLTELAGAIDLVATAPEWPRKLRGRLRAGADSRGVLPEILLAARALSAGLAVAFAPKVGPRGEADFALSQGADRLVVEVTRLADMSDPAQAELAFHRRLYPGPRLMLAGLASGCRLAIHVLLEERASLQARMDAFWSERIDTVSPGGIEIPEVLAAWAAPEDDPSSHEAFLEKGLPGGFEAPPTADPVSMRIARAIRQKARQLPDDEQGLIVLELPTLIAFLTPAENLVEPLVAILDDLPTVAGAAIMARRRPVDLEAPPAPPVRRHGQGVVYSVPEAQFHVRATTVVLDAARATPATDRLVDRWLQTHPPRLPQRPGRSGRT